MPVDPSRPRKHRGEGAHRSDPWPTGGDVPLPEVLADRLTFQPHGTQGPTPLQELTFHIPPGGSLLLAGDTGTGKSMLLKMIAGLAGLYPEPRASGTLTVRFPDDKEPKTPEPEATSGRSQDPTPLSLPTPRPGRIALVSQSPRDGLVSLDVFAALALPLEEQGVAPRETCRRVEDALQHLGLLELAWRDVATLSSGEARRVALAGAIAQQASLLLLDEPFADLDPAGVQLLRSDLAGRVGRATVVVAEHRAHLAQDLMDATLHLMPGGNREGHTPDPKWWPKPTATTTRSTNAKPPKVSADRLRIERGGRRLLDQVDLDLGPGVWGLLGANGTGKSSLLLTLAGLLAPQQGRVQIAGIPVYQGPRRVRPKARLERRLRTTLQIAFQEPREAFFAPTTRDELTAPLQTLHARAPKKAQAIAQDALEQAHAGALAERSPQRLSGGQARFVQLLGALLVEPRVLFLDEPTHGLDPGLRAALTRLLDDLAAQGNVVVVATHEPEVLPPRSDWLFLPGDGFLLQGDDAAPGASRPSKAGFTALRSDAQNIKTGRTEKDGVGP